MRKLNKVRGFAVALCLFGLVGPVAVFAAGPAPINLGTAGNFVVLAKTGVSTTGSTAVVGDIGLSPAAASYITGFALALPAASAFSTSALVSGKIYAPGYADPTPANLTSAVLDMQNAYTDGAGRAPTATELGAGTIGGLTLAPGTYTWGTNVSIPTDLTLSGGANDVWIFVIAQNLTVSSGTKIILSGGAQPSNVFWVVGGQTTIGTTAVFSGTILDQTAIVLNTGAALNGRALAQTAVTLDSDSVTSPSGAGIAYVSPSNPTPSSVMYPSSNNTVSYSYPASAPIPAVPTSYANTPTATAPSASPYNAPVRTIGIDLATGSSGTHVEILQQFLISQHAGSSAQALAAVGATGHFGALTRAALAEFQANVGISPALGNFGPITRAYLGAHY